MLSAVQGCDDVAGEDFSGERDAEEGEGEEYEEERELFRDGKGILFRSIFDSAVANILFRDKIMTFTPDRDKLPYFSCACGIRPVQTADSGNSLLRAAHVQGNIPPRVECPRRCQS